MSKLNEFLKFILTFLLVTLVFLLGSSGFMQSPSEKILTIDMQKVVTAHNQLIGRSAMQDLDASLGLMNVSKKIDEAIKYVAGDSLVVVSQVVASERVADITNAVIERLGLDIPKAYEPKYIQPEKLPEWSPNEAANFDEFYKMHLEYLEGKKQNKELLEKAIEIESIVP